MNHTHTHTHTHTRCHVSSLITYAGIFGDLSGPRSTAEAVGVLAAIVAIHECGHFIAARAQGIHVTKFAIGFGPPLLSYQVQASRLLSISFAHGRLKHAS